MIYLKENKNDNIFLQNMYNIFSLKNYDTQAPVVQHRGHTTCVMVIGDIPCCSEYAETSQSSQSGYTLWCGDSKQWNSTLAVVGP